MRRYEMMTLKGTLPAASMRFDRIPRNTANDRYALIESNVYFDTAHQFEALALFSSIWQLSSSDVFLHAAFKFEQTFPPNGIGMRFMITFQIGAKKKACADDDFNSTRRIVMWCTYIFNENRFLHISPDLGVNIWIVKKCPWKKEVFYHHYEHLMCRITISSVAIMKLDDFLLNLVISIDIEKFCTYFHRNSDENIMTRSKNIEQTPIIADVCRVELFRKFASKF